MHREVVQMLRAGETLWYGHAASFEYDQLGRLPLISAPTLILTNTGDLTYALAKRAAAIRPDLAYLELTGGTHDIVDEQPDEIADAVAGFILRHPPPRRRRDRGRGQRGGGLLVGPQLGLDARREIAQGGQFFREPLRSARRDLHVTQGQGADVRAMEAQRHRHAAFAFVGRFEGCIILLADLLSSREYPSMPSPLPYGGGSARSWAANTAAWASAGRWLRHTSPAAEYSMEA